MTKPRYAATVSRLSRLALFEARGRPDGLKAVISDADLPWPAEFNRIAAAGGVDVARIGPKRVLIMASAELEKGLATRMEQAFSATLTADFAMLSDSFVTFSIDGADAEQLLRQGAPIDLALPVFPPGAIAGTELWATSVFIARMGQGEPGFRLLIEESYADYIENWLAVANGIPSANKPGTMMRPPASLKP